MQRNLKLDWIIVSCLSLLIFLSLLIIYSFTSSQGPNALGEGFFYRQLGASLIGLVLMFSLASYDYRTFLRFSTPLYFFALGLLILVIVLGENIRGTTGWLNLVFFNFQPVELVKVILIIFLASFFAKKRVEFGMNTKILASFIMVAIPVFFVMRQPDLGSSLIIVFIWIGMLLASKIGKKNIAVILILGLLISGGSFFFLEDYQVNRLKNFINPFQDPQGSGYNVIQSMIAIGSGGMTGKGLGHGSQSQLNFLPEKHTDFIFASLAEELGFLGAIFVLTLFITIFYRMYQMAKYSRDNFGYLLVVGTMILIFSQSVINIGMNMGIAPVTGVPLPFLSYGGSAIVSILILMGIILSVYRKRLKTLD